MTPSLCRLREAPSHLSCDTVFPIPCCQTLAVLPPTKKIEGFARDDVAWMAFSKHIRCTLREINPFPPIPSFRAQREIFLALCSFLLLSQKVSPFPLSHIRRYTGVQERSLGFARDDDTGIALSQHILYTMRRISPYDAKEKSPGRSRSFFVSERLICQTVRAWCLLLLQYQ